MKILEAVCRCRTVQVASAAPVEKVRNTRLLGN
jgi:hypothetical protein